MISFESVSGRGLDKQWTRAAFALACVFSAVMIGFDFAQFRAVACIPISHHADPGLSAGRAIASIVTFSCALRIASPSERPAVA